MMSPLLPPKMLDPLDELPFNNFACCPFYPFRTNHHSTQLLHPACFCHGAAEIVDGAKFFTVFAILACIFAGAPVVVDGE